jgi:hypothetical protein
MADENTCSETLVKVSIDSETVSLLDMIRNTSQEENARDHLAVMTTSELSCGLCFTGKTLNSCHIIRDTSQTDEPLDVCLCNKCMVNLRYEDISKIRGNLYAPKLRKSVILL